MWLLTVMIASIFGTYIVKALPSGCTSVVLPSNNTRVECTKPTPGAFPNNTEQLIITGGKWPLLKEYIFRLKALRHLKLYKMDSREMSSVLGNDSFVKLTSLEKLDLSAAYFIIVGQYAFRGLSNLKDLDLSDSFSYNRDLPEDVFHGLNNLETLNLHAAFQLKIHENSFKGLSNLQKLNLSRSLGLDIADNSFKWLTNLQILDLHKINSMQLSSKMFGMLTNLRYLDIEADDYQTIEADVFRPLVNLKELRLSFVYFDNAVPETLLSGLSALETLYLKSSLPGKPKIPYTLFAGLHNLKHLNLETYSDYNIPNITGLGNLQTIKLPAKCCYEPRCSCHLSSAVNKIKSKVINKDAPICNLYGEVYYRRKNIYEVKCSDVPVPPYYRHKLPAIPKVEEDTFTIKLIEFDEIDGKIRNYDVIVLDNDSGEFWFNNSAYTNDDISTGKYGLFVASRITDRAMFGKEIVVGKDPQRKALIPGTKYSVFLRGYVNDTNYRNTGWYQSIWDKSYFWTYGTKPKPATGFAGWKIALIVIAVVLAIIIVVAVIWKRSRPPVNVDAEYKGQVAVVG